MGKRLALVVIVVVAMGGCGKSEDKEGAVRKETLLEALARGVKFRNAVRRDGSIPSADPAVGTVTLQVPQSTLSLDPGSASLIALDIENPDTSNPATATLLQFKGADSHSEVPIEDNADAIDGGSGTGEALHIENPFDVEDDICAYLCAQRYTTTLSLAIELDDGAVTARASIEIVLDCSDAGDPDLCDDGPSGGDPDGAAGSGGGSGGGGNGGASATGSMDGSVGGEDGGTGTNDAGGAGSVDAAGEDAATGGDAGAGLNGPQVSLLTPQSTPASMAVTLTIDGSGFSEDAVVYVDGSEVSTTFVSDQQLEAEVSASATALAGSLAVFVENDAGDASTRSNVLYLQVQAAAGAPVIFDYSPDNGVAGDTILIIASGLAGQTLNIEDADGTTLTAGTTGTISWPTAGTADTVEVVLPNGIVSGPITVTTALGSYRGKIFSVGMNLTRASGTTVDSSSEYNTTNWSRASGADNYLATSFFTAIGDCATLASCTMQPWYEVKFSSAQTVERIAMRGNREYESGYDFIRGRFEVLGSSGNVLWTGTYDLPAPDRDLDIVLSSPVNNARSVKFTSLEDESNEPGFAELEVF